VSDNVPYLYFGYGMATFFIAFQIILDQVQKSLVNAGFVLKTGISTYSQGPKMSFHIYPQNHVLVDFSVFIYYRFKVNWESLHKRQAVCEIYTQNKGMEALDRLSFVNYVLGRAHQVPNVPTQVDWIEAAFLMVPKLVKVVLNSAKVGECPVHVVSHGSDGTWGNKGRHSTSFLSESCYSDHKETAALGLFVL